MATAEPKRKQARTKSRKARGQSGGGIGKSPGDSSEGPTPDSQLAIFEVLGPSVGIDLRGVLETSDPRTQAPGVYHVIFGIPWPTPPGRGALTKTHLRQMARHIRSTVKQLHPRLLKGFRELEAAVRNGGLEILTQYRLWLAVRFLVERQTHSEAVAAFRHSARRLVSEPRRRQILDAVARLRRIMETAPRNSVFVPLPAISYGWPPELRQLANSLAQMEDLPGVVDRYVNSAEVRLICEDMPTDQSTVRDPVAHVAVRALDRVLELDATRPTARSRRRFIGTILNAVSPKGYRSESHPFGPQDAAGKWSDRTIRQHAETPTAMEEILTGPA